MMFGRGRTQQFYHIIIIILIFALSSKLPVIFFGAYKSIRNFYNAKCSYERLRLNDPVFSAIFEAKQILQKDAKVDISPPPLGPGRGQGFKRVKARYALYPIKFLRYGEDWDYFIDLETSLKNAPENLKRQKLSSGITVFAKPGFDFISQSSTSTYSILRLVLVFMSIQVFFVFTGVGILALLNITIKNNSLLWYLSNSYICGFLTLSSVVWLFLIVGIDLERPNILLSWMVTSFFIFSFKIKWFLKNWRDLVSSKKIELRFLKRFDLLSLSFLVSLLIISIVLLTCLEPVFSHDAMNHWIIKSKVIFQEKQLVFDYTHHNEYPILWPLNIAVQFSLLGGYYDEIAKWTTAILVIAFITQLVGAFYFLRVSYKWICVLLILYFACFFHHSITWAYAEAPFLAFLTGCLAAILGWLRYPSKTNYMILGILMAMGLTLVKLEGGVASAILGTALIFSCRKDLISNKALFLAVGLLLVPILEIGWIIWIKSAGYLPTIFHATSSLSLEKLILILRQCVINANLSNIGNGLFAGILFIALLKFIRNHTKQEILLLNISIALVLFCGFAFIGWRTEAISMGSATTADNRLFLHSTPSILLFLGSLLREQD